MKFLIAKNNDKMCLGCRGSILYGEHYFQKFSYKVKRVFFFHIDCYRKWSDENFVKVYLKWKEGLNPPRKRGRPRIPTKDRKKRRQLLSLLAYHRKAGNLDRVGEIERKIKGLEVKE